MRTLRKQRRDQLTGLANRSSLLSHLERLARRKKAHVLILLDLDSFKPFNMHNGGHAAGDALLVELGSHLANSAPRRCRSFRLGSDEFVMVLRSPDRSQALDLAEQTREFVSSVLAPPQPDRCGDKNCIGPTPVSCSIGVAEWKPNTPVAQLLCEANDSMWDAKLSGGNAVRPGI